MPLLRHPLAVVVLGGFLSIPCTFASTSEAEAQLQGSGGMRSSPRRSELGSKSSSTSSIGSRVRDDDRSVSTSRTKNSTQPSSNDDSWDDDDRDSRRSSDRFDDDEDRDEKDRSAGEGDYDDRTLGKACMYGVDGKVIYRPEGARCRGDAPAAPAAGKRDRPTSVTPERSTLPSARRSPTAPRATRSTAPAPPASPSGDVAPNESPRQPMPSSAPR